jgi:glycosyltransferase involved in cell wall biosynthesis
MEKAVVGTRLAFEGLMEGSGEFGFVAENADEFAERTCALLRNADLARSVGQRARRLVQSEFSWDAFASFYEHIYTVTLGLKSPTRLDQSNLEGTPEGEKTVQEY